MQWSMIAVEMHYFVWSSVNDTADTSNTIINHKYAAK